MPDIAALHPQIVHVAIVLGIVGVLFRLASLTPWLPWTRQAATALILVAAVFSYLAAESGHQAHGPVERVPGAREAVEEHEETGELARNLFLVLGAVEIVGLALFRKPRIQRLVFIASGLVGIAASWAIYEAGEHGGELAYSYAGGIGLRTGNPQDVQRLLIAGLYHESQAARRAGREDEAARLIQELGRQVPDDPGVRLMVIESTLKDRHDPATALRALDSMNLAGDNPRLAIQAGVIRSDALVALGQPDSARAVLQQLKQQYPTSRSVDDALGRIP